MTSVARPDIGAVRPSPTGLADVVETVLDKGLVLDAYERVALVGVEVATVDSRVVIVSVDTYLEFADAVNWLDLSETEPRQLTDLLDDVPQGPVGSTTTGVLKTAGDTLWGALGAAAGDERRPGGE